MSAHTTEASLRAERLGLLRTRPILQGLPASVLEDIDAALESVHVDGGARIVAQGEVGVPFIFVVRGGLRASFMDAGGHRHVVFEYFRGGTLGEALVLGGRPSPLDVHAIRDSHLLYLTPERFSALCVRHPEIALEFARGVTGRLVGLLDSPEMLASFSRKVDRLPRSLAVLTVGGDEVRRTRDFLIQALSFALATTRLGVREATAVVPARDGNWDHGKLIDWLERIADSSDLVVFECDRSDASWLDFCLRQADRIIVLLECEESRPAESSLAWWRAASLGERAAQVELAVVHPRSTDLPRGGAAYTLLPGITRLHHVRAADRHDAERLARWLLNRPVGLALGGGGAYGIAHVGVLKALEEAGVPLDIVGGTSMGAVFAGGRALGWSADRIMEQVRRIFSSRFALYDPTIPSTSLLGGKKLDRVLEALFQDFSIADLWIPFFCITTNISHARPQVHDSGSLKDAIRASCSIPGLFPPRRAGSDILVDGGLVDNLPIDVMGERCRGPIIAVNVLPYGRERHDAHRQSRRRPLRSWLGRLRPWTELSPPLFDILTRATFVGSQRTTEMSLSRHPPALYLVPTVETFRILDWRAHEALFQAGYACAKRALTSAAFPRTLWEGRLDD